MLFVFYALIDAYFVYMGHVTKQIQGCVTGLNRNAPSAPQSTVMADSCSGDASLRPGGLLEVESKTNAAK